MKDQMDKQIKSHELQPYKMAELPSTYLADLPHGRHDTDDVHLRDYLNVILRRKTVFIIFFVSAIVLTMAISFLMTPLYQATAVIKIDTRDPNVLSIPGLPSKEGSNFYQTQYEILKSRSLAEKVITAAALREEMEVAIASVRANVGPWMRSRLAHALMAEALKRFRDRAQGPMLKAASNYFRQMTGAEFLRLLIEDVDDELVLVAERKNGARITVDKMSEGTRDQLYLALRLAALEARRSAGANMPLILDDMLATSDDHRAALILKALAEFSRNTQVIVLTHHQHLVGVAQRNVPDDLLSVLNLQVQRLG